MQRFLIPIATLFFLIGCDSGNGDGGISGNGPEIKSVRIINAAGRSIRTVDRGQEFKLKVTIHDPDLDANKWEATLFAQNNSDTPYMGPLFGDIPNQSFSEDNYITEEPIVIPKDAPTGAWRLEYQVTDNQLNASNTFGLTFTVR